MRKLFRASGVCNAHYGSQQVAEDPSLLHKTLPAQPALVLQIGMAYRQLATVVASVQGSSVHILDCVDAKPTAVDAPPAFTTL